MVRWRFRDLAIANKLLLLYGSILLIALGASGALVYQILERAIEREIEQHLSNSKDLIVDMVRTSARVSVRNHLRGIAEKNRDILAFLAREAGTDRQRQAEAKALATKILLAQKVGRTGYIYCIDSSGTVVVHPRSELLGTKVTQFPFVHEQINKREGYIEYDWANPGETVARPKALYMTYFATWDWIVSVTSYRQEFNELVRVEDFRNQIRALQFGQTGYPFLIDEKGMIIIHPTLEGVDVRSLVDVHGGRFGQEMLETKRGRIQYAWKNPGENEVRTKLLVFDSIPEFGWIVAASCYVEEVFQPLHTARWAIFGSALGSLLAAVILTFWVSSLITKPLKNLTEQMTTENEGGLPFPIPAGGGDEIGRLGKIFHSFIARLENREKALAASERQYRELFENSVAGVFRTSQDGQLISANPALARMLGYGDPETLIRMTSDIGTVHYVDPSRRLLFLEQIREEGVVTDFEVQLKRRDGRKIWVTINGRAVKDAAGNTLYTEGFQTDITARRAAEERRAALEEQLLQAQKMESLGRMAGGVAHDFNNLLTGILGNVELGLFDTPPQDPVHPRLIEIQKAAETAAALTRKLLAFSRKQIVTPKSLDLNQQIESFRPLLLRMLGEEVALETRLEAELWPILADPGQVENILGNLAINARDAMPQGGTLTITTQNANLDADYCRNRLDTVPGDYILLTIADSGEGMSEEVRAHLFEPFFTTKPIGKGTGLGLPSVYGTVRQAGGSIEVDSEAGRGTVFKLYLPRANKPAEPEPEREITGPLPGGTETILLVEDDPAVLRMARESLMRNGYKVHPFSRPLEALAFLEQNPNEVQLLLTDVVMPEMNGRILAEETVKRRPGIRILFSSGYTAEMIVHHQVFQDQIQFLAKPYAPPALLRKVREVLDSPHTVQK